MMFLNTLKLFFSNFVQFWKYLGYKVLAVGFSILLLLPFWNTFASLDFVPFWGFAKKLFVTFPFSDLGGWFNLIYNCIFEIFELFKTLWTSNAFCFVYVAFVLVFVAPFLLSLCSVSIGEVFYGSMSSHTKKSFIGNFIKTIGKSCRFSALKTLFDIPFFALMFAIDWCLIKLAVNFDVWLVFAPFLMISVFAVIEGVKNSLVAGWLPALVVFPCNATKAFSKGFAVTGRRYFRVLSTTICMAFLWACVFYIFGIISLVAIAPISQMMLLIFDFVMFFSSQGMSFYVDYDTVLTQKKLEQTDKISKAKNVI